MRTTGNGQNGHLKPSTNGGLGGPSVPDLKERRHLCRAVRWPTTPEDRKLVLAKLRQAFKRAKTPREISQLSKALAQIEAQNQADDHLMDKNDRLDGGSATERVEHREFILEFDRKG